MDRRFKAIPWKPDDLGNFVRFLDRHPNAVPRQANGEPMSASQIRERCLWLRWDGLSWRVA